MGKKNVIYVDEDYISEIVRGLDRFFNVSYLDLLTPGLEMGIMNTRGDEKIHGLVTHFPYDKKFHTRQGVTNLSREEYYKGLYLSARTLVRGIRDTNPDLGIVVYTGAGFSDPRGVPKDVEEMNEIVGGIIMASGANGYVFKSDSVRDAVDVVESMRALLEV